MNAFARAAPCTAPLHRAGDVVVVPVAARGEPVAAGCTVTRYTCRTTALARACTGMTVCPEPMSAPPPPACVNNPRAASPTPWAPPPPPRSCTRTA